MPKNQRKLRKAVADLRARVHLLPKAPAKNRWPGAIFAADTRHADRLHVRKAANVLELPRQVSPGRDRRGAVQGDVPAGPLARAAHGAGGENREQERHRAAGELENPDPPAAAEDLLLHAGEEVQP